MDEEFLLSDFSLEDIDFDFDIYKEDSLSPNETTLQRFDQSSDFDRLMPKPKPVVKPMKKINNKPQLISFGFSGNVSSSPAMEELSLEPLVKRGIKRKTCSNGTRSPVLAKEHVIAERKRREDLSQKFIALLALLPGLKKADKITVLDEAISRMKQLQEQIRKLKEEKEAAREMESLVLVKKSKLLFCQEHNLSSSPLDHNQFDQELPEIEAKVSQHEVLIRIHCEKSKGSMINILNTIEKLQLSIKNSVVLPFGNTTLDITVLAQMEKDVSKTVVKDLVRNLSLAMV